MILKVKEGGMRNLKEFARINVRKKTESFSANEIERAVLDITGR